MRLSIPAIRIGSDIVPVTAEDRVLQIPPQPWVVGWWSDGAGSGAAAGTVVLTAHLDSREYGTGPFVRVHELSAGSPASIRDAAGRDWPFQVEAVRSYRKSALPYQELFDQTGPFRAVLVTCGGTYDPATGWDSNVVVTFLPTA